MGRRGAGVPVGCPLSARQFEVVELVANGWHYKQVAVMLGLAVSTIRTHVHHAYQLLGVENSHQALREFGRRGWIAWTEAPTPEPGYWQTRPFLAAYLAVIDRAGWPLVLSPEEHEACSAALAGDAAWRA